MPLTTNHDGPAAGTGCRLHRFEVLNWGTFHRHIWTLAPGGENSLLTGDIGSGKSTLVDALTTLMVPPQRIVYNKAAGAETRERSLRSYVFGHFKSEKDADTLSAKSVALRDINSYSAILAQFFNAGYERWFTLAQVFWSRETGSVPERFYVVATAPLTIAEDFSGFGTDVMDLKKRLGKQPGVQIFDSYSKYATAFRRGLGIDNTQALDLFYQTVSMKSVGNLTDFVRRHMLEEPPVAERIEKICRQFDDLNRAHEAVLKAREQVAALAPIVAESARFAEIQQAISDLRLGRSALHAFFAEKKIFLLERRIRARSGSLEKLASRIEAGRIELENLRIKQRRIERAISDSGGRRLEEIAEEIFRLVAERTRIADKAKTFAHISRQLKRPVPTDEAGFVENRSHLAEAKAGVAAQQTDLENEMVEQRVDLERMNTELNTLESEIASLKGRKSNIPERNLAIRSHLIAALGLTGDDLPFAGELLRVKGTAADWEGAAERLLHNFGLSLLVPEIHYKIVAAHVDATHLAGRLVYFKTTAGSGRAPEPPAADALVRKLEIKPDTAFYNWLERELERRFSHTCCETPGAFRRCPTALTRAGQIKTGGIRHEKDDRYRIDDRTRFVLGWQNKEKIRALEKRFQGLEKARDAVVIELEKIYNRRKSAEEVRDRLQSLLSFERFAEIHWEPLAVEIDRLSEEKARIEAGSDTLKDLQAQLARLGQHLGQTEDRLGNLRENRAKMEERLDQDRRLCQESQRILDELPPETRQNLFSALTAMAPEALEDRTVTIENCDALQTRMREWLQRRMDNEEDKGKRIRDRVIRLMQAYKERYRAETREVDAAMDAAGAFREMLETLLREDLPRHEQRFKQKLNEETIQSMALFQGKLDSELSQIREKIETINRSLSAIDYNEGTYIALTADPDRDQEIRRFREELRACLGETLTGGENEAYTEHKFLQVKELIDRFNGRQGQSDMDRRWTRKVTDVRNWLAFSVAERWREDNKEKEFYSDTAGKSGGQKEKLAYTILASALAYQFGLKWGEKRSRTLRFVMIDEAFGRGSDESTRYALELFKKLNLQLLIVTPLQKINIIEDYVSAVHYIHNPDGQNSMVRNLTIEQYREEKAAFAESAA
ncbi:MAG: SbcC/MukB-like Walker B domain-containing protein [Pseudomonadota bacterium]